MIKINLVREGRAVRGTGAATGAASAVSGPTNLNNVFLGALLIAGIVVAGGWYFLENRKLSERQDLLVQKQAEAKRLEAIIKEVENYKKQKESLKTRIDLINQLKQNQKGPARLMDRISQDLPDLVWLDKMTVIGNTVTLDGRGLNPNAIANFVESIKNDPMFEEPDLGSVTQVSAVPLVYSYTMNFHFTYAPKGAPGTAGAATSTAPGNAAPATGTAATPPTSTAPKR
ncbi:MAG TPA: PilN domain-containing protein [Thermoanaerobaculia bacterium]|nr:PilN domain-containing protein [Thermoanaerobaculia bacterium]